MYADRLEDAGKRPPEEKEEKKWGHDLFDNDAKEPSDDKAYQYKNSLSGYERKHRQIRIRRSEPQDHWMTRPRFYPGKEPDRDHSEDAPRRKRRRYHSDSEDDRRHYDDDDDDRDQSRSRSPRRRYHRSSRHSHDRPSTS